MQVNPAHAMDDRRRAPFVIQLHGKRFYCKGCVSSISPLGADSLPHWRRSKNRRYSLTGLRPDPCSHRRKKRQGRFHVAAINDCLAEHRPAGDVAAAARLGYRGAGRHGREVTVRLLQTRTS
ncbi:hypothetical protein [Bradyrhizobium sp. B117]|uniref:hypothetical protein n=1 Tax=Bradyrhizobium sp. B117 TaxID=3140246 RepID=UPI0031835966